MFPPPWSAHRPSPSSLTKTGIEVFPPGWVFTRENVRLLSSAFSQADHLLLSIHSRLSSFHLAWSGVRLYFGRRVQLWSFFIRYPPHGANATTGTTATNLDGATAATAATVATVVTAATATTVVAATEVITVTFTVAFTATEVVNVHGPETVVFGRRSSRCFVHFFGFLSSSLQTRPHPLRQSFV